MDSTWWDRIKATLWRPFEWWRQARCAHRIPVDLEPGWTGGACCERCGLAVTVYRETEE